MTTSVDSSTAIMAHVPVDRFEIVDGPDAAKVLEVKARLLAVSRYEWLTFTLLTAASAERFNLSLAVTSIFNVTEDAFDFTATFRNVIVSGTYDKKEMTGWFSLDLLP